MDLHKAAINSDFVTYVDPNSSQSLIKTVRVSTESCKYSNFKLSQPKCTCRCICSRNNRPNILNERSTSSNVDFSSRKCVKSFKKEHIIPPTTSNSWKSYSATNSPNHQIHQYIPELRSNSIFKKKTNIESVFKPRRYNESKIISNVQDFKSEVNFSQIKDNDSPNVIELLESLQLQSNQLKEKINTLEEIRGGLLKHMDNVFSAEQTNTSLSSSDRTDSKDSGMASISNDQTRTNQTSSKLPKKSILKNPLKNLSEKNETSQSLRCEENPTRINILSSENYQDPPNRTETCFRSQWNHIIPEDSNRHLDLYMTRFRRRSLDFDSPCQISTQKEENLKFLSNIDLQNNEYNKRTFESTTEPYENNNSSALDIICLLENQLSAPPSPAPQIPDAFYFKK